MIKYIHGSEDSLDIDVYYVFDIMPSFRECQEFCSDKQENRNIIVIKDGVVIDCYKGTNDEINNGLYYTYNLHLQTYSNPIEKLVKRDILIKSIRVVRCLLSHLSRTQYRNEVKMALSSSDWMLKVNTLKNIDLTQVHDFGKNGTKFDVLKVFAFQLGQVLGLHDNVELYTKSSTAERYPDLRKFLYREEEDIKFLIPYLNRFLDLISLYQFEVDGDITYFKDFDKRINLKTEKYL